MHLIGKSWYRSKTGEINWTLHGTDDFPPYYSNDSSHGCEGNTCISEFVGSYDCSNLPLGAEIEIYYGKAITTSKGTSFQPVKRIAVLKE